MSSIYDVYSKELSNSRAFISVLCIEKVCNASKHAHVIPYHRKQIYFQCVYTDIRKPLILAQSKLLQFLIGTEEDRQEDWAQKSKRTREIVSERVRERKEIERKRDSETVI